VHSKLIFVDLKWNGPDPYTSIILIVIMFFRLFMVYIINSVRQIVADFKGEICSHKNFANFFKRVMKNILIHIRLVVEVDGRHNKHVGM